MKLIFVTIMLAVNRYGQASVPFIIPSVTISSEQCASQSAVDTIIKSLKENLTDQIIKNHFTTDACESCNCDNSWTRVSYLNMTDSSQTCPSAWATVNSPVRACGRRPINGGSCDSVLYSTNGLSYTQVCGRIIGYQYGNTDAFWSSVTEYTGLNSWYVDGVSLTHGPIGQRTHVWTFANALYEINTVKFADGCPCMLSNLSEWPYTLPSYVGNNYFCVTGTRTKPGRTLFSDNPLWDGVGCTGNNTCCQFNQPPWFNTTLPTVTSDDLEVRICANWYTSEENTYISNIELYVK